MSPSPHRVAPQLRTPFLCFLLSVCLLALAACGDGGPNGDDSAATSADGAAQTAEPLEPLKLEPCTFDGLEENLECGRMEVWEDPAAQSGRKIELNVVRIPALSDTPQPDAIFLFAGGPGDAAASDPAAVANFQKAFRRDRDIVLVDQRGTGGSNPLRCKTPGDMDDVQGFFEEYLPQEVVDACRRELETQADLTLYTTSIAMDDVDQVREALGYDKIDLVGGSYGTRAAQVYMKRHPEHVRAAVLQGVAGMEQYLPSYHAPDAQGALDLIFEACDKQPSCAEAFPNLRTEFQETLARLNAEPARVEIPHPETGKPVVVTVSGEALAEGFRFLNYSPSTAITLPLAIHMAYEGDYELPTRLVLRWQQQIRQIIAFGMHLSVVCAEDRPFYTEEEAARRAEGSFLGDLRVRQIIRACDAWPKGEIPEGFHAPVTADAPTLLITGTYDPVTPPYWGERVAAELPHHLHVNIPDGHHGMDGLANPDCLEKLMLDFVDRGSVEGLDTSCVDTMKRPDFLTDPEVLRQGLAQAFGDGGEEGGEPAAGEEERDAA